MSNYKDYYALIRTGKKKREMNLQAEKNLKFFFCVFLLFKWKFC